jgi:hypothetical protein
MLGWLDQMTQPDRRYKFGRHLEALTDEVFHVFRWTLMVGFARFLATEFPSPLLDLLYWALAMLLFGYLSSRFLLRPELRIFQTRDQLWKRLLQSFVNFLLCIVIFMLVLWTVQELSATIAQYRTIVN